MGRSPHSRHFIRQWRKHRGLTLEQLADRIDMTHQNLGKIERFLVPYNQNLLETLAEVLRCEPPDLIMRDPTLPNPWRKIEDQFRRLEAPEQEKVIRVIDAMTRTGTND